MEFIEQTGTKIYYRLSNHYTFIQAVVKMMTESLKWVDTKMEPGKVNTFKDSQSSIQATATETVTVYHMAYYSKGARNCETWKL